MPKVDVKQFQNDPDDMLTVSLNKLVGKKVKDLEGYVSAPYGATVFALHRVVFEDDTDMWMEGAHDLAYPYSYGSTGKSAKFLVELDDLYDEDEDE